VKEIDGKLYQLYILVVTMNLARIIEESHGFFKTLGKCDIEPIGIEFQFVSVQMHILGLSTHCRTAKMASKIGGTVDEVIDNCV